jgi:hypothetical protein
MCNKYYIQFLFYTNRHYLEAHSRTNIPPVYNLLVIKTEFGFEQLYSWFVTY